jgi:ribosomal protein S18 acetylase RimI-like enzyme
VDITFELYQEPDFEELATMIFALYTEDPEGERLTLEKIRLTVTEAEKHKDKLAIWIFRRKGIVAGYGILNFFWSNEYGGDIVNIDEIYVKSEARGLGIATMFIESLSLMYPKGCALKLEASHSNMNAIKFYRQIGFEEAPNLHMIRKQSR